MTQFLTAFGTHLEWRAKGALGPRLLMKVVVILISEMVGSVTPICIVSVAVENLHGNAAAS